MGLYRTVVEANRWSGKNKEYKWRIIRIYYSSNVYTYVYGFGIKICVILRVCQKKGISPSMHEWFGPEKRKQLPKGEESLIIF